MRLETFLLEVSGKLGGTLDLLYRAAGEWGAHQPAGPHHLDLHPLMNNHFPAPKRNKPRTHRGPGQGERAGGGRARVAGQAGAAQQAHLGSAPHSPRRPARSRAPPRAPVGTGRCCLWVTDKTEGGTHVGDTGRRPRSGWDAQPPDLGQGRPPRPGSPAPQSRPWSFRNENEGAHPPRQVRASGQLGAPDTTCCRPGRVRTPAAPSEQNAWRRGPDRRGAEGCDCSWPAGQ